MATIKKKTTATKAANKPKIEEVAINVTDEEKILGVIPEEKIQKVVKYESDEISYKVTNLRLNNKPVIVDGTVIETFIGTNNKKARNLLKQGEKVVITKDYDGKEEYKIEVIEK